MRKQVDITSAQPLNNLEGGTSNSDHIQLCGIKDISIITYTHFYPLLGALFLK